MVSRSRGGHSVASVWLDRRSGNGLPAVTPDVRVEVGAKVWGRAVRGDGGDVARDSAAAARRTETGRRTEGARGGTGGKVSEVLDRGQEGRRRGSVVGLGVVMWPTLLLWRRVRGLSEAKGGL